MYRVAIVGATGYAGQELVRILARHPRVELTVATGSQATSTPRRLPALARIWNGEIRPLDVTEVTRHADVAFLALPEAASAELAPSLLAAGLKVIDLSGAFRLRDRSARERWYPATAAMPEGVAYGLTEFEKPAIQNAKLVSNPLERRRVSARISRRTTAASRRTERSATAIRQKWSRRSDERSRSCHTSCLWIGESWPPIMCGLSKPRLLRK